MKFDNSKRMARLEVFIKTQTKQDDLKKTKKNKQKSPTPPSPKKTSPTQRRKSVVATLHESGSSVSTCPTTPTDSSSNVSTSQVLSIMKATNSSQSASSRSIESRGNDDLFPIHTSQDTLHVQSSWQQLQLQYPTTTKAHGILGKSILLRMIQADPKTRTTLGITSFRSPRVQELVLLLWSTIDSIVTHAGPSLWDEDFHYWQVQWVAAGLDSTLVALVLIDSIQEHATTTNWTSAVERAWQRTVVTVLARWAGSLTTSL